MRANPWFGRVEPQQLLERGRDQRRVGAKLRLQLRALREVVDRAREQRGRRDVRGDQQLPQAAGDELVLERLAVDPHREQRADQVLARVERRRLARRDDLPALGVEVLVLALGRLDVEVGLRVLEALAARVQLPRVLARQVEDVGEDEPGVRAS